VKGPTVACEGLAIVLRYEPGEQSIMVTFHCDRPEDAARVYADLDGALEEGGSFTLDFFGHKSDRTIAS
jgi:hypothetical protein